MRNWCYHQIPLPGGDASLVWIISGGWVPSSPVNMRFATSEIRYNELIPVVAKLAQGKNRASLLVHIQELIVKTVHWWSYTNTFTIKENYCGLSYGAWLECFPINVTLEAESDLYQLSYQSLPIHISAKAIQAGGQVANANAYWSVLCNI